MLRYLAILWDAQDLRQVELAQQFADRIRVRLTSLRPISTNAGSSIFCASENAAPLQVYPLDQHAGLVLGKLFPREPDEHTVPRAVAMDEDATRATLRTAGRHLIDAYWGRYVAFVRDEPARTLRVIRDPTGGIPCFVYEY